MRIRLLAFSVLLGFTVACRAARPGPTFGLTPADWDRFAGRQTPCPAGDTAAVRAPEVTWRLAEPAGALLRLPAAFREVAGGRPRLRRWAAPDSSRLELRATEEPESGLATSGPLRVEVEGRCALPVAGRRALVTRLRITDPVAGRVVYAAAADAFVRPGVALGAWVESPAAGTRDAVLRALGALELGPAR